MIHRKHVLAAVASCAIAALATAAVVSTVTQAEAGSTWKVKGVNVEPPLEPGVGLELEKLGVNGPRHLILLTTLGETKVEILCEELITTGTLLPSGRSSGELKLYKCSTYLDGTLSTACTPEEPITATVKDLIVLNGGAPYDLFEPAFGETFGVIKFKKGCFLPEEVPITGSFYAKESNGNFQVEAVTHLFAEAAGLGGLFFGNEPMTIDGSANASLFGVHVGLKWSGRPA